MTSPLKVTQHDDGRTKPPVAIACSDGCRVLVAQQAGLPVSGQRRVPGLRRSEVAALAGMSVEYYAKLERGALAGVSAGVLDALARALQLDDADGAPAAVAQEADGSSGILRRARPRQWASGPACDGRWTPSRLRPRSWETTGCIFLAANQLGRAMYSAAPGPQRSAELRPTHLPRLVRPTLLPELRPGRRPRRRLSHRSESPAAAGAGTPIR